MIADLRSLARALGGEVSGGQVLAPGPGHGPRDRSLSVRLSAAAPDGFIAFSHAYDDWQSCRDHVRRKLGLSREPYSPRERPKRAAPALTDQDRAVFVAAKIAEIIRELAPIRGSPGEAYLRDTRRIDIEAIVDILERTDAIGWHGAILFREEGHALDGRRVGCIIGVMTDAVTAALTGAISRTYLREGRKIGKAKSLGAGGGVVRLSRDEDVLEGLFLGEGLETCLAAAAMSFRPIWATGSASIMAKFPVLSGIECIVALDPFVKLHSLNENDSGDMNFVCDLLVRLAVEHKIAVDIPHHVHKGQVTPGDADAGRGSSGIRDAGRLTYTLTPMSVDEAKLLGVETEDRFSYVRLDSAKVNIAPREARPSGSISSACRSTTERQTIRPATPCRWRSPGRRQNYGPVSTAGPSTRSSTRSRLGCRMMSATPQRRIPRSARPGRLSNQLRRKRPSSNAAPSSASGWRTACLKPKPITAAP
jgi:hypothetical protein